MANELQVFENPEFGTVRTIIKNGEPYFVGKDVASILGYTAERNAIAAHVDEEDKLTHRFSASGQNREMTIINESGLYSLILSSKLPAAKKFKRWVTSEVLPSIRKTGSYTAKHAKPDDAMQSKRLEVMERNARTRAANLLLKIAERTNIPEYKAVCNAKAAEMVAGEMFLPLPVAERRTYSATEIGAMFGVSANKIGKLANMHKLKVPEYAKLFYSKSEHSVKEVETWRYYDSVVPVFEKIFGREAV
ncbi:BRO-N domain-containing protein [Selenomonas sputigena]|uniref:BRO family, N-terminal domain protein n=1 Tax=Selenomonas sputigena (strain ATCC 35185 / DSM 20758 / CCUG 44933 / VPI D19B-28) TaxID=546271 RepID=C9LU74_SELS3|nr:Bro-N domain-containing protein [Selenomonas sputigena]AEC00300.1 prophage antirepressor [Selenomonas sputigena ATCC 35185]EEX77605.1 BRO family, N-terminal domain protein [Selenomonas sputigena ATCC 35185]